MARKFGVIAAPTRATLLERLKNPADSESWQQFFAQYGPGMLDRARLSGLTEDEAKDISQDVASCVYAQIPTFQYQPEKGCFRGFLSRILGWRIQDKLRKRLPRGVRDASCCSEVQDGDILENLPDPRTLEPDKAWEKRLWVEILTAACKRAREKVRPEHYQVFDLLNFHGYSARRVARLLGIQTGNVDVINLRVKRAIAEEVKKYQKQLGMKSSAGEAGFYGNSSDYPCFRLE
jgi:RNA polymerase sigma factor (sigma-70 family)